METPPPETYSLARGYDDAYNLNFTGAEQQFTGWERSNPKAALGPVSEAAGLLFSEFDRLGVLQSQFFADDQQFAKREKLAPDPKIKAEFDDALRRTQAEASAELARDPKDADALFAMALMNGLRADYLAMVEKRNLDSLSATRQANAWAQKLLTESPGYYDAYLATGMSKYIIGSLAAPLRWILRVGGYSGDKQQGIRELSLTAAHGRYLAPFARLLLAVAFIRQKDPTHARALLQGLEEEFPANPLFAREIARLDSQK